MKVAAAGRCLLMLSLLTPLAACVSNSERIERLASDGKLLREQITGVNFEHVIYTNEAALHGPAQQRLYLFIDGDGRPWGDTGRAPAADPTSGNPLALRLLLQTPAAAAYISRPCYQGLMSLRCQPGLWTAERYSQQVVATLTTAIERWSSAHGYREIVLIGYSGGGTLAVLVGEQLRSTVAVVTLAGNLDVEEWARHHDYLPLTGSLNPASSTLRHPWPELHLRGENDSVVPSSTTDAYFVRFTAAQRRSLSGYGHACCWVENWSSTFAMLQRELPQ